MTDVTSPDARPEWNSLTLASGKIHAQPPDGVQVGHQTIRLGLTQTVYSYFVI